jgi:addiction module RelE/StbE family toxin
MLPVEWRAQASADLFDVLSYIADRNESAATSLAEAIEQATSQLPQHPYLYRLGRVEGTREIVVHPNYLVVYRVGSITIEIVAVVHARQQFPRRDVLSK